jgi:hypothetical protein
VTRALLRRDLTFVMAPFLWACGALFGYVMSAAASIDLAHGTGPGSLDPARTHLAWMLWLIMIVVFNDFGGGRMWEKATQMHMQLPVSARDIWKARNVAIQVAMTGSALIACLAFWLRYESPIHPFQVALAFNAVCLVILAPFLYYSVRVSTIKWGMPIPIFLPLLAAIIWALSRVGYKTLWPGIITLVLTLVLAAVTYRRMPPSFEIEIRGAGVKGWLSRQTETAGGLLERLPWLRSWIRMDRILRPGKVLSKPQLSFILSLAVVINVFLLSLSAYGLLLIFIALHGVWFLRCLNGVSRASHLPIARSSYFVHTMLPGLVLFAAAVWISVSVLPSIAVGGGPSAKSIAAGVAYYIIAWWLILSFSMAGYFTPSTTARGWKLRYFTRPRLWIGLLLTVVPFVMHMAHWITSGTIMARPFPGPLADAIPLSAPVLWTLSAVFLVATQLDLRKQFLEIELAPLRKGIEP